MVATLVFQADKQFHRSDNTLGVFRYQLWSRTINDSHGCVPACRSILMLTSRSSHACLKVLQPLSLKKVFPFLVAEKADNYLSSMKISSGKFRGWVSSDLHSEICCDLFSSSFVCVHFIVRSLVTFKCHKWAVRKVPLNLSLPLEMTDAINERNWAKKISKISGYFAGTNNKTNNQQIQKNNRMSQWRQMLSIRIPKLEISRRNGRMMTRA